MDDRGQTRQVEVRHEDQGQITEEGRGGRVVIV